MPVIRNSASAYYGTALHVESKPKRSAKVPRTPTRKASDNSKAHKRKKTSNAFFLYRSYVLANNLIAADVKQNDVSRIAAQMWKDESQKTRINFFTLAEEIRKKQRDLEDNEPEVSVPPVPELSPSSSSTRSFFDSPPPTPTSPCLRTPPAPKMRPRELPTLPSISSPQRWETRPVLQPEVVPMPNYDEPLISPLSDEWYSHCSASSLAFSRRLDCSSANSRSRQTCSYSSVPQSAFPSPVDLAYSPLNHRY